MCWSTNGHSNVHRSVLVLAVLQVPLKAWSDLACCVFISLTISVLQTRKETAVSISMLVHSHLAPFIVNQGWVFGLGRFGTEMLFISVILLPLHLGNTWTAHSKEGFLLLQVPILTNLAVPPAECIWIFSAFGISSEVGLYLSYAMLSCLLLGFW